MPWYSAGSVAVTNNSNAVTGTGTDFISNARVGDGFIGPDGRIYQVTNVASATAISISPNYVGTSGSGQTYKIVPIQGYNAESARLMREIIVNWGDQLSNQQPWTYAPTPAAARDELELGNAAQATLVSSLLDTTSGRVMTVGSHGIGGVSRNVGNNPADINNITSSGFYDSGSVPGTPMGSYPSLISAVTGSGGSSRLQIGGSVTDYNALLFRKYHAGSWGTSRQIWHEGNLPRASGSFTPTVGGRTTPGTAVYSVQDGSYNREGNVVHCRMRITWSSVSGASGSWAIRNLPFVPAALGSGAMGFLNGITVGADYRASWVVNTNGIMDIYTLSAVNGAAGLMPLPSSGDLILTFSYSV